MKYYRHPDGRVFAYETEEERLQYGPPELVEMSPSEVQAHLGNGGQPAVKTRFTPLEFIDRFTDDEQLAIVSATLQVPAVKLWYDKLLAASYIDLTDPRVEVGIDAIISAGLLAPERKAEVLAPEVL